MRLLSLLAFMVPAALVAQLPRPTNWQVRTDGSADTVYFVQMAPGWHITTGPGTVLFDPQRAASGRFTLSMDVHLFPGKSEEGYGLFIGGSGLDGPSPTYVRFVARRSGQGAIERVRGSQVEVLVPWSTNDAIKPHPGTDDTVLNTLVVRADMDSVRFEANGKRVAALPRVQVTTDGVFGLRAGSGVNLHVTNLDQTIRLAPTPAPKR
jgi:hypothetical protein